MPRYRQFVLTAIALVAFAANSLLCRAALKSASVDPATFTTIRLVSGALVLWLLMRVRRRSAPGTGNWLSAAALFAYAAGFSFAYITLSAATGALLLFGAVQATMIGRGLWNGERLREVQLAGLLLALTGVLALLLPDAAAPALFPSLLMLGAGLAWGIYSLRGKGAGDPLSVTAGNFLRAVPMAVGLNLCTAASVHLDTAGFAYAVVSGALASGAGYAVWYSVLPSLQASTASIAQLGVPIIAAAAAIVFLGEPLTARFALSALTVLGGIWLVLGGRHASARGPEKHSGAGLEHADTVLPSDETAATHRTD
ncbi:MAG: DMT family transporter [Arenimonas sp.]